MKHSTLFTTSILVLFFLGIIGISGCGENGLTPTSHTKKYDQQGSFKSSAMVNKSFETAAYLTLSTYNLLKMSQKDIKTYNEAIDRVDIYKKDGRYRIKQTSGAQVNISEALYKYIKEGLANTNRYISPNTPNYSPPHLISMSEGSGGGEQSFGDCVAQAIAHAGNIPYQEAESYISRNYPNGPTLSDMTDIMHHFYPDSYKSGNPEDANDHKTIDVFQTSSSTAHAVNGAGYKERQDLLNYHDYQNNINGQIEPSDVIQQWVVPHGGAQ